MGSDRDPRRRTDERYSRMERSHIPFLETYREFVFEKQPLGKPLEREIIVLRIEKSGLKLYAALFVFVVVIFVLTYLYGE